MVKSVRSSLDQAVRVRAPSCRDITLCLVRKTLYSHSASLHPGTGVSMDIGEGNSGGNPAMD